MHPQRLFLLYVVSNSGKRYWDCKLPCIEAQIELSSTFVYYQKMSTSGGSARNSHLSQGGRMRVRQNYNSLRENNLTLLTKKNESGEKDMEIFFLTANH